MSGVISCNISIASIPSLATATLNPWRSKKREVTLRTVTESSTTRMVDLDSIRPLLASAAFVIFLTNCALRIRAIRSKISITEPSPMIVAAETPGIFDNCWPKGLTTTSMREPAI